jgi:hypothetical protein
MPVKERVQRSYAQSGQRRKAAATRVSPGSTAPPSMGGVPNDRGYPKDEPRDKSSLVCCALLRPDPPHPPATSDLRQRPFYDGKPRSGGD